MIIADDIILHVNNFVERQRKHHLRLQGLMKEVDNSNSAIGLVQELAVMMNEINMASELYGRAFKPALDALWAEILETKKEAVKIVQREAEEPPVMYVGSHWVKGFPVITDEDTQNGQLFVIISGEECGLAMAGMGSGLRPVLRDIGSAYLCTDEEDLDWHMRIPRPTEGTEK